MKKTISLTLALLIALMPSTNALAAQGAEENLQQIIENAKSTLDNGSLEELIEAIKNLSNGIVEYNKVKDIKSIRLTGNLNKYEYYLGEKINLEGIKLIAQYNDNTEEEFPLSNIKDSDIYLKSLLNSDIIPYDSNTKAGAYVLVLKIGNLDVQNGSIIVSFEENKTSLETIEIKSLPKTEYIQGEPLDITGLVVEGTYSDGTKKVIDNNSLNLTGFETNKLGQQTITIKFNNKTTTYIITVKEDEESEKPDEPDSIDIDRLVYTPKGGFSGEIVVTLNKATQTKLEAKDFSVHCPGLSEMSIVSVSTDDNKTYKLSTPSYSDNNYILEIYFANKTLEGSFIVKSDCPIISYPYVTRTSDQGATFKFNADETGNVYYIVKEANPNLRANDNTPTESELKAGKKATIASGPNEINIETLKANTKYELYYMTSKNNNNSVVYGPVIISEEVEKDATGSITIVKIESKKSTGTQDIVITLSEATEVPLTLDAFKVVCPASATLRFDTVENGTGANKNKVYTLKMRGGFYDNNYEVTVNFPDGTYAKGSFKSKLGTPALTGFEITRISETTAKIVFESSMDGYIYYGISEEMYVKPPYDEFIANLSNYPRQKIHMGKNTLTLDNVLNDMEKYFYWLPENGTGNRQNYIEGAGKLNKIPTKITDENPDEPTEQESKIKIESIELSEKYGFKGVKFTFSEDVEMLNLVNAEITFEGDNGSLPERYLYLSSEPTGQKRTFFIDFRKYPLSKGTYTLRIKFKDGVAKKDITFTEDVNK